MYLCSGKLRRRRGCLTQDCRIGGPNAAGRHRFRRWPRPKRARGGRGRCAKGGGPGTRREGLAGGHAGAGSTSASGTTGARAHSIVVNSAWGVESALAGGTHHARQHLLGVGALAGAVAAARPAGDHRGADGLLRPPVGGVYRRVAQEEEHRRELVGQVLGEALGGGQRRRGVEQPTKPGVRMVADAVLAVADAVLVVADSLEDLVPGTWRKAEHRLRWRSPTGCPFAESQRPLVRAAPRGRNKESRTNRRGEVGQVPLRRTERPVVVG